jgi:hypothetical protein
MATSKKTTSAVKSKSTTATTATTPAKPRTKARKPPVAERVTVSAPVVVPTTSPATSPPAASPPPATPPGPAAPVPAPSPAPAALAPASPAAGSGSSASSAGSGTADTPVGAPPPVTMPAVPAGFVAANPADLRGYRALASQVAAVPDALAELQVFGNYAAVFGITAPDVGQLTQRLSVAYDRTMLLSQTTAWYKYAKSQQGMAWKDAQLLLDALKPPFGLAATANPALLSQYPAIARLLGAKTVVAKRAASSRAKNAKTAAGATAQAPAPAPAGAGAAGTNGGATNGTNGAGAQGAATRVVTGQG